MDFSLFLTIVAAAIGFFVIRRFRFDPENNETDSPPPSSLCSAASPPSSLCSVSLSSPPSLSPSPPSSLSPSSVLPSASSSHNSSHDVFPSFRGEDIRGNFLSHVQKEFRSKGITYFNDNGIERGESIGPELIKAIRGSKIAIILLSKKYASSKWCLDELVEIMKCKETVIPVFYKVDPSDVKKLRGYFGKVFEKTCEGKSKEDTEIWRHALMKVAAIAGYDSSTWVTEAAMIEKIATDVLKKLINCVPSSDFDSLVGMRAHMEKMKPLLLLDSNEVRMIGIWGPSGIGKSTMARFLFNQSSHDFQLSVCLDNIKRDYPRPCYDVYSAKLQLQNKFLSLILGQKDFTIPHLGVAQDRLKDKKVLVILDDVDHSAQLDALAKGPSWFGPGSRIIVTTQDKKILIAHGINHIYEVGFPQDDDALEIFCINAFGQKSPYDGFEGLAREVTWHVGKLPLGLSVMGSYLKGLSKEVWERELPRLRTRLNGDIENTLKFSYEVLCDEEQALFLHIACLFNGERIDKVEEFLAEKFVTVEGLLRVLAEKSLISVDSGIIWMHDLLARLGREIVRHQSPNEPGQRQFLVDNGDIRQVLRKGTLGNRSVIGIYFQLDDVLKISDGAFEKMSNVQFLKFHERYHLRQSQYVSRPYILESVNCLPREARLLHWIRFPMTCLPSNFNPEFLVEINMSHSNLEKLWEGNKTIRNLKWMNLSHSKNLKELSNLSTATNLLELDLTDCSSLELPSSIENLTNLKKLILNMCSNLVELPSSIGNMTNLENLDLYGCSNLVGLPSSIGNLTSLNKLDLRGCSSLVELPPSVGNMTNLEKLYLFMCVNLVELPSSIGNLHNLQNLYLRGCSKLKALPININMKSLDELNLSDCSSMKRFPEIFTNIRVLKINGTAIEDIPASISSWSRLERLHVSYCENLWRSQHVFDRIRELYLRESGIQEISPWIKEMSCLEQLVINKCSNLQKLPSSIGNLTSLNKLDLRGCSSLVGLHSSIGNMTNLENLNLSGCSSLVDLPSSIGNMTNLEKLDLSMCVNLVELPSSIGNLHNLQNLSLWGCSKLKALPININMKSLDELDLSNCSSMKRFPEISTNIRVLMIDGTAIEDIPASISSWSRLERLHVSYCENLWRSRHAFDRIRELYLSQSGIQEISPWVKEMSCLEQLVIYKCSNLQKLPSYIGNLTSLNKLDLTGCSSLVDLPSSIGNMTNLKTLDLFICSSLVELPPSIGNMTNLKTLDLNGCLRLVELPPSVGNMTNLEKLYLSMCVNLVELPSSIGNLHNLQNLSLRGCSKLKALPININMKSLDELNLSDCSSMKRFPEISTNIRVLKINGTAIEDIPASISSWSRLERLHVSYCENLWRSQHVFDRIRELYLSQSGIQEISPWVKEMSCLEQLVINKCSNLQKLPSSIGNLTNLNILYLTECSSLVELPFSIGNITNLEELILWECSSLVELPSSIGNLHNLKMLNLRGCSKLMALPVNINIKSLDQLDLTDCWLLKSFPEISTNIRVLSLIGTAVEEIPASIRSWSRLDTLDMPYSEKLEKSQHAFDLITELHFTDTGIQEIPPCVKEMSRLHTLAINGCSNLASLPQLPDSLQIIVAENCESLERLDCLFYKTKFTELSFVDCFELNQESIDLILKTSTKRLAVFPVEEVPTYFSYRATGSSVSMKLNGLDIACFPTSLRFKACLLLVTKPDVEAAAWFKSGMSYCINDKLRNFYFFSEDSLLWDKPCPRSEHLVIFEFEDAVTSPELVFEFRFNEENLEIKECGIRPLENLALSC